jgi:hypothetical protein
MEIYIIPLPSLGEVQVILLKPDCFFFGLIRS